MVKVEKLNASKEVVAVSGATDAEVIAMRRESLWNGFRPKVKFGDEIVTLGYHFYTPEERAAYKAYYAEHKNTGGNGSSSKTAEIRGELVSFAETLKGEAKKELEAIIKKYFPDPTLQKLQNKIAGLSDAEKEALKALLG